MEKIVKTAERNSVSQKYHKFIFFDKLELMFVLVQYVVFNETYVHTCTLNQNC